MNSPNIRLLTHQNWKLLKDSSKHLAKYYTIPAGTPGSGVGKGGGAGGTVKESGGGLGRFGAAQEEGYFYNKDRKLMEKLKQKQKDESHKDDANKK